MRKAIADELGIAVNIVNIVVQEVSGRLRRASDGGKVNLKKRGKVLNDSVVLIDHLLISVALVVLEEQDSSEVIERSENN